MLPFRGFADKGFDGLKKKMVERRPR